MIRSKRARLGLGQDLTARIRLRQLVGDVEVLVGIPCMQPIQVIVRI